MKPAELWFECSAAQAAGAGVMLTIPKGNWPKGFPRGGELLNEMERGGVAERTYLFDPKKVAAFMIKHNLIGANSLYSKCAE